jgi:hypothetical protein
MIDRMAQDIYGRLARLERELERRRVEVPNAVTPSARCHHSANQSVATGTAKLLDFNTEIWDTDALFDPTNNSVFTIRTAGKYLVVVSLEWAANVTGSRQIAIKRGSTYLAVDSRPAAIAGRQTSMTLSVIVDLAVNDVLTVEAFQDSGGAVVVNSGSPYSPEFMIGWIGP